MDIIKGPTHKAQTGLLPPRPVLWWRWWQLLWRAAGGRCSS
jgi:hypothetical protein